MCTHTSPHCRNVFSSSFKYNLQIQTENLHLKLFIHLKNVKIQTSLISISSKSLTQACFFKPNDLSLSPQYTGCHIFMETPTQPVLVSFSSQCTQNPRPHFPQYSLLSYSSSWRIHSNRAVQQRKVLPREPLLLCKSHA